MEAPSDALVQVLAEALCGLVDYVERRPEDATDDDDVNALEDVAHALSGVPSESVPRLVEALGIERSRALGLAE